MKKTTKQNSPILVKKDALKNMSHDDFGGILENIHEMFVVMTEGLNIANDRGDRLEGRMDRMEGKVDKMEGRMDRMEGKVDSMQTEMRSGFKTVMEYLTRIDNEIQEIKVELSQKAQIKEVRELQSRVLKLELELMSLRNSLHTQKT